jgi:hypothetical protein
MICPTGFCHEESNEHLKSIPYKSKVFVKELHLTGLGLLLPLARDRNDGAGADQWGRKAGG